jgi:Alternative complex III, ActD subunit
MNLPHPDLYGLLGEFDSPDELMEAAKKVRKAGYRRIDAFAPFPVEGLSQALGLGRKHNLVPLLTLAGGLGGGLTGFFFQLWANTSSYPMNIAGRPLNSWPAFIPVTFELTVLGASLFAVFGMLALNKLPQPHHPLFNVERFKRASNDKFFLCIEARDPNFHLENTARFLQSISAQHVTEVRDED